MMKTNFEDINDWLDSIIQSTDEELAESFDPLFNLFERVKLQTEINKDLLNTFHRNLIGHKQEEEIWEYTLFYYSRKLPDEICMYLIDKKIALLNLGHTDQSDNVLWILGEYVEEAALTLGKRIFCSDTYDINDLEKLLDKYHDLHWLWQSFLYEWASDEVKEDLFNSRLESRTDFSDIKEKKIELETEAMLMQTDSLEIIEKYYSENNPRYIRALAHNPNTPIECLIEMQKIKKVRFANDIRYWATENIKGRGN